MRQPARATRNEWRCRGRAAVHPRTRGGRRGRPAGRPPVQRRRGARQKRRVGGVLPLRRLHQRRSRCGRRLPAPHRRRRGKPAGAGVELHARNQSPVPGRGRRRPRGAGLDQEEQGKTGLDRQAADSGRHRGRRQPGGGVRADVARPRRPGAGRPDPDHADARPGPDHLLDARSEAGRTRGRRGRHVRRQLPRLPAERRRPQPPVRVAAAIEPPEKPAAGADPVDRRRSLARRG